MTLDAAAGLTTLTTALADRYRVERELGQGGMATVYLAHDLRHDRKVALKVLRPELAAVIGAERFLSEIRTTANLQHPHILPLFDSGQVNGTVFYVMPYVQGESLRDRLTRERQLPIDDAIRIAREVADALTQAHAAGIVHRDIKPENILLQGGHALVADFGIALAISAAGPTRLTETGMSLGTPHYMSPEQAMGERTLDGRSDVYALGAVLYEMLVGEPPFTGPTAQVILAKAMTERPVAPHVIRDTVPRAVEVATLKALAKLPADRFATAAAFADALQREDDRPVTAAPRRPMAVAIAITAAVALVIGAAGTWGLMRAKSGRTGSSDRPSRYSIALPDSAPLITPYDDIGAPRRSLAVAPDGRSIVYVAGTSRGRRLWLIRLDGGPSEELPETQDAFGPYYSADSREVAFIGKGGRAIQRMVLASRSVFTVLDSPYGLGNLVWNADGMIYFSPSIYSGGACVFAVPATGGGVRPVGPDGRAVNCGLFGPGPPGTGSLAVAEEEQAGLLSGSGRFTELVIGGAPLFLPGGGMAFVRGGTALGAELDPRTAKATGDPHPLFTGVLRESNGVVNWRITDDGTLIWVAGPDGRLGRLAWADSAGRVIDTIPAEPVPVRSVVLSPDGHKLALKVLLDRGPARVRILDLVGHAVDEIPGSEGLSPNAWIEGGRALGLSRHGDNATLVARPRDSGWTVDTSGAGYFAASADDNLRCGSRSGQFAFWPRSAPADVIRLGDEGFFCSFSPNGRWLIWVTLDAAYVIPTSARNADARIKVVVGAGGGEPRWLPDNRGFYLRRSDGMYLVTLPAHAGERLSPPRKVFEDTFLAAPDWSFDVAPDGRLLVIVGEPGARTNRLEVMTNFPEFVRSRLAEGRGTRP